MKKQILMLFIIFLFPSIAWSDDEKYEVSPMQCAEIRTCLQEELGLQYRIDRLLGKKEESALEKKEKECEKNKVLETGICDNAELKKDCILDVSLLCTQKELKKTYGERTKIKKWEIIKKVSEFTDEKDIYLELDSLGKVNCDPVKKSKITLVLRCLENKTNLYIKTECYMSDQMGQGKVDYRLDDEKSKHVYMEASTSNKSLGLWSGKKSIPFIKQMLDNQKLLIRITPYKENDIKTTFYLDGIKEAIKPLREACDW